jgi:Ca2+/Na+ antiporter
MWLISPAILVTYGIAWTVAAAMSEVKWLKLMGPASFVGTIILALMSGLPEMFLANAAALLLLAGLPGVLLMRGQPSEVV